MTAGYAYALTGAYGARDHDAHVVVHTGSGCMRVRQLRFGDWVFEPGACSLVRGEERVVLEPLVSDLLEFFLMHPEEVHTHDRLVAEVWHGRVVSDEAVRRAVSVLRRAANGAFSTCIRTVYKRGYRASFPVSASLERRLRSPDGLVRECDVSLTRCSTLPAPASAKTREALDCLRNALELDPRLLEILSPSGLHRQLR